MINDLIIIPDSNKIKNKYSYKTLKIEKLYTKNETNIDFMHYGGKVEKIAKLQDSPFYFVIDSLNNILGIAVRKSELDKIEEKKINKPTKK
jgi:hypothetical protein